MTMILLFHSQKKKRERENIFLSCVDFFSFIFFLERGKGGVVGKGKKITLM